MPADIDEIMSLGVPVIEDCAQAVGAVYKGKKVGSFGRLSCFSFYTTKVLSTGEGGMVISDSENLLKKIRDIREYDNRKNYAIRYNYKMTDIHAAMGLSQFKKLNSFLLKRINIAKKYSSELRGICNTPAIYYKDRKHVFYRFVVQVSGNVSKALDFFLKEVWPACDQFIGHFINTFHFVDFQILMQPGTMLYLYQYIHP